MAERNVPIAKAELSDVRSITALLKAVSFSPRVWFFFTEEGIRLCVEIGRSVQALAYLPSGIFQTYTYNAPPPDSSATETPSQQGEEPDSSTCIEINLETLLQCLDIFGNAGVPNESKFKKKKNYNRDRDEDEEDELDDRYSKAPVEKSGKATAMQMSYAGQGHPLVVLLEEEGTVTRCELQTYDPEDMLQMPFDDNTRVAKVIMKSEWLKDALNDVDNSTDRLAFSFLPASANKKAKKTKKGEASAQPTFRLEALGGNLGNTEIDFPFDRDLVEMFECEREVRNSYGYSYLKHLKEALNSSTKTSIRTDAEGLLSMQFLMPVYQPKNDTRTAKQLENGFVEFLCMPKDDERDE